MPHTKATLPTKTCASCGRPFSWRKKWQRDWNEVIYCSDRCRMARGARRAASAGPDGGAIGKDPA